MDPRDIARVLKDVDRVPRAPLTELRDIAPIVIGDSRSGG
jgi:hypothetical protein